MSLSSEEMMTQFNGHFDNIATASTNSGAALDQLAATTTTQYSYIKALLTSLKAAAANGAHSAAATTTAAPPTSQEQSKNLTQQLEAAVRNNWYRGEFFSTHGWGVNENHSSANFRSQKLAIPPLPLALPRPVRERPSTRAGMTSCPVVLPTAPDVSGPLALN